MWGDDLYYQFLWGMWVQGRHFALEQWETLSSLLTRFWYKFSWNREKSKAIVRGLQRENK